MTLPSLDQVRAELARRRLHHFVREFWPVVEPGVHFVDGMHIKAICEHLEAVADGRIKRLIINVPPRHGKSTLVSVMWPAWIWATRPSARWMFASYALSLSVRDSVRCRRLLESPRYRAWYGAAWRLAGDQNTKLRLDTDQGGYRLATSVGGSVTGEGGDFLVVDDAHNAVEIGSDIIRKGVLDWFDHAFATRASDPKLSAFVVIGQRLHEEDITGHLTRKGGWDNLVLPMERE